MLLEEEEPAELRAARDRLAAFTAARQAEAEEAPPGAVVRRAVLNSACAGLHLHGSHMGISLLPCRRAGGCRCGGCA